MRWELQPLGPWTEPKTEQRRSASLFRVKWDDVVSQLLYEVDMLGGNLVIIQIDADRDAIRRDGGLRANARVGAFPGVRVSFTGDRGPLTFASDAYEQRYGGGLKSWQANVHAVGLGMEALRAVDRYGISQRGQQYTGFTAIESRPAAMTREQAAEFIAHWAGLDASNGGVARMLADPAGLATAYRHAAKRAHPDAGGDADTMARLTAARDLLAGGVR